ncbi:MAG TPA: hypothetical protein VIX86_04620 [Streptosporangiaceae bacterium]
MGDHLTSALVGVLILATLFMLVRPGSPALSAVKAVSDALGALVGAATGFTQTGGQGAAQTGG